MMTSWRVVSITVALSLVLLIVMLFSLLKGSVAISLGEFIDIVQGESDGVARSIIVDIRVPRVLMAGVVGAGLATAGVAFQALLKNPLAEPYILGVSSGSAFGAILALMTGLFSEWFLPLASFSGGLITILTVYFLGSVNGRLHTATMILAGVMVSAFFGALIMFLLSIATFQEIGSALFWLMGDLSAATFKKTIIAFLYCMAGFLLLYRNFRGFNLLSIGEETAQHLGFNVEALKIIIFIIASLITGISVAFAGLIGFIGLVVPHSARLLFGGNHRILLPASALLGGSFLILSDMIARTVISPAELPVGVITAAIGAPLFIYLLKRNSA
jgi:iron complex transport system permease protein